MISSFAKIKSRLHDIAGYFDLKAVFALIKDRIKAYKSGRLDDRTFITRISVSVFSLVLCIAAMGFSAYALFNHTVIMNTAVKTANYGISFALDGGAPVTKYMNEDFAVTFDESKIGTTSTLLLSRINEQGMAPAGFCLITVNDTDELGQPRTVRYHTSPLNDGTESVALTFNVLSAGTVTLRAHWGSFASYPGLSAEGNDFSATVTAGSVLDIGNAPSSVKYNTFTHSDSFVNVDSYVYRVGNGNAVKLGSLFKVSAAGDQDVDGNNVSIKVESVEADASVTGAGTGVDESGNARCTYTKNASDWSNSTLKFSGEGPVRVTIRESTGESYTLALEILNANNATTAVSATSANIVLLNNVSGGLTVSGGHILYGNGFEVIDTRAPESSGTKGDSNSYVTINGGVADNVFFRGYEPVSQPVFVGSGENTKADTGPAVLINGSGSRLYNCRVSGGRYAVYCSAVSDVLLKNTVIDGGAVACLRIVNSFVTLEDCVTSVSTLGGLRGIGIHVTSASSGHLTIKGSLVQHNWLKKDDLPGEYQPVFGSLFDNADLAYTYGGSKYIDCGIFFMSDSEATDSSQAKAFITDPNDGDYVYSAKTYSTYGGSLRSARASSCSAEMIAGAVSSRAQYDTLPSTSFDFTEKNYSRIDEDNYCYYDSTSHKVLISKKQQTATDVFTWDPMILSVSKYGKDLGYTVSMNGTDYTSGNIVFSESGDYTVTYSYTDPYNYDSGLNKSSRAYTTTVDLNVLIIAPESVSYHPEFSYAGSWSGYSAKTVTVGSEIYVMPDASDVSSTVGSTTVGGQTVYYPIVTVDGKSSNGGNYSSGKIYCFAPAFSAINIKDLNVNTGETLYTYNSSTQTWPHGISAATGPGNSPYYGPASTRDPYGAATGTTYEKYAYNNSNGGLCFTSNEIERNITANTKTVKFHYVGNDGVTYYYYIQYKYLAVTHKSGGCFVVGTLITLADGTQKPIEELTEDDKIMTWDFKSGQYALKDVALLVDHGESNNSVVNLGFSDGTVLRTVADHGLFDFDLNRFVYINAENCTDYIGHNFVEYSNDGSYTVVELVSAFVTQETGHIYSVTSAINMNAFANGILTVAPPEDFYNWMPMGKELKYDMEQFYADVEKYGVYVYEDFADYVTYEQFIDWGGAWLKIPVEKGCFSFDYVIDLIEQYKQWMQ